MSELIAPPGFEELAVALAEATNAGRPVRFVGGGTKLGWGAETPADALRISTSAIDGTIAHNAGDLTATFAAGAPLARIQAELADAGQMLALDPPSGFDTARATIGGIFATADAGPLQHRYGAPRDLILGITVALADGTIAHAGGNVIKNVAGYDLGRLFTGSMGSLGAILSVSVRLHPRLPAHATVVGSSADADRLAAAVATLAAQPLELEALDLSWRDGHGQLLARCAGSGGAAMTARLDQLFGEAGLEALESFDGDDHLWERQRTRQRSRDRAVVRVVAPRTALAAVLRLADACEATVVGRAGLGILYLTLNVNQIAAVRAGLPDGAVAGVRDLPLTARSAVAVWPIFGERELALMRAVKREFDPSGTCNPGIWGAGS